MYIENPKTKGSGILCCIPQSGTCPIGCSDCFFQSGRSYLEPLEKNLPNIPDSAEGMVVRMNDGNDSSHQRDLVIQTALKYRDVFFNTSVASQCWKFPGPVVLTVNPGRLTDINFNRCELTNNLMFVRFRVNTWNLELCDEAVHYYTEAGIPVVLTFMAYYNDTIPEDHAKYYTFRKRTLNAYWVITQQGWDFVKDRYCDNNLVYTCGKDSDTHSCSRCGNCLREYFATKTRLDGYPCP
jgi:hypothetical protein